MINDGEAFDIIEGIAKRFYDGHFTVMSFTTNWKLCFGSQPNSRDEIQGMTCGKTLGDALINHLSGKFDE
jgi:hypothetical protein